MSSSDEKPSSGPESASAPRRNTGRRTDMHAATTSSGEQGTTMIADVVVQKIAGIAAREVPGVNSLGGSGQRAFGAVRERIPGGTTNVGQGVSVEVGETQAAIDFSIVVEYGVSIGELAAGLRQNVITAVERMTSLGVIEVNINVVDIHLPEDDVSEQPAEPRVQ